MSREPGNFAPSGWQIAKFHEDQVHLRCPYAPASRPCGRSWLQNLRPRSVRLRRDTAQCTGFPRWPPLSPVPSSCPSHLCSTGSEPWPRIETCGRFLKSQCSAHTQVEQNQNLWGGNPPLRPLFYVPINMTYMVLKPFWKINKVFEIGIPSDERKKISSHFEHLKGETTVLN